MERRLRRRSVCLNLLVQTSEVLKDKEGKWFGADMVHICNPST
jgi:hypothetical protein